MDMLRNDTCRGGTKGVQGIVCLGRFDMFLFRCFEMSRPRWWQLKSALLAPQPLGKESNLSDIFQLGGEKHHQLVQF